MNVHLTPSPQRNRLFAYAKVESVSRPGVDYYVSARVLGIRGGRVALRYRCGCPDFVLRWRECKHVGSFKGEVEKAVLEWKP